MSEYLHVEKPFLDQLAALGWTVIDQGQGFIPCDPTASLRDTFREWLLPEVFRDAVRAINITSDGTPWLTDRQLDDLRSQILRQPNRTLLEANGSPGSWVSGVVLNIWRFVTGHGKFLGHASMFCRPAKRSTR